MFRFHLGTARRLFFVILLAVLLAPRGVLAATTTGRVTGAVLDPTGLPVEAADVEITSPSLIGKSRRAKTTPEGEFRFIDLPPGVYALAVKAEGFRDARVERLQVQVGQTATADVVLEPPVATTEEAVVVTARRPRWTPSAPNWAAPSTARSPSASTPAATTRAWRC